MKAPLDYSAFVASLSEEKQAELVKLSTNYKKQEQASTKASVAAGELAFSIHNLLASTRQVRNYCREQNIVRQTFYNNIRAFQWEQLVPAEFKEIAENHGMSFDYAAQNAIIRIALKEKPGTVADADKALAALAATASESTEDPIVTAINRAAHLLVAACKGQLDKVAHLVQYEETFGIAQSTMEGTATNIMAASQLIAQKAFEDIRQIANKREDLKGLKLPEQVMITNPNVGPKHLPAS